MFLLSGKLHQPKRKATGTHKVTNSELIRGIIGIGGCLAICVLMRSRFSTQELQTTADYLSGNGGERMGVWWDSPVT